MSSSSAAAVEEPVAGAVDADGKPKLSWASHALRHVSGTFSDPVKVAKRLAYAAEHLHLVGGATLAPLKVGHEVVITVVPIEWGDVYPTNKTAKQLAKGKTVSEEDLAEEPPLWGIGKATLNRVSAAASVEWEGGGRVDDGSVPHFCHWHAVGRYPLADGTMRRIEGDRDIDLRDGSPQIEGLSALQLEGLRQTIVRQAITKAKLRALREAFGIELGMTEDRLMRPFVVARIVFTGHSDDPEIRRLFAATIAQQQLQATAALYGAPAPRVRGAAGAARSPSFGDDDDLGDEPAWAAEAPKAPPPPTPPKSEKVWTVPFGRNQGKTLDQLPSSDLEFFEQHFAKAVANPKRKKYRRFDEEGLAAVRAFKARKKAEAAGTAADGTIPFGPFRGRALGALSDEELASLIDDCAARAGGPDGPEANAAKALLKSARALQKERSLDEDDFPESWGR